MRIHRVAALVAVFALAGCGTPGGDSDDNAEKAQESNADAAKVDVALAARREDPRRLGERLEQQRRARAWRRDDEHRPLDPPPHVHRRRALFELRIQRRMHEHLPDHLPLRYVAQRRIERLEQRPVLPPPAPGHPMQVPQLAPVIEKPPDDGRHLIEQLDERGLFLAPEALRQRFELVEMQADRGAHARLRADEAQLVTARSLPLGEAKRLGRAGHVEQHDFREDREQHCPHNCSVSTRLISAKRPASTSSVRSMMSCGV